MTFWPCLTINQELNIIFSRPFATFEEPTWCSVVVVGGEYTHRVEAVVRKVDKIGDLFGRAPEAMVVFPGSALSGNVQKNKEIAFNEDSWGPLFRISFDLIIHSHVRGKWSSVLGKDSK